MGFARAADVPVVLIGDIDRGGVIASLAGTRLVLDPDDAAMIRGFIVNRFRGDPALFADGMRMIGELTGWQSVGLLPHFADAARLPAEDALGLNAPSVRKAGAKIRIAVPILPHISISTISIRWKRSRMSISSGSGRDRPFPAIAISCCSPVRRRRYPISGR